MYKDTMAINAASVQTARVKKVSKILRMNRKNLT